MVKRPGPTSKSRARISRKRTSSRLLDFDPRALDHIQAMVRDPDGTINYWGPGLERLYGFSTADVVGRVSHKILKTEFPRSLKEI